MKKKIVLQGSFENVIEIDNHYYLLDLKDKICVVPYTLAANGLLDKIGVVEDFNVIKEENILTLLHDYVYDDDQTDLVGANRILFNVLGTNVNSATKWMYLGSLFNNLSSDSPIKIYAVNISDTEIKENEEIEENKEKKKFKLIDVSRAVQSDDMLILASFFRLFNYFYIQSLIKKEEE